MAAQIKVRENMSECYAVKHIKTADIATENSVALKGHKYSIDSIDVTKSHRLVIDTASQ